MFKLDPAQVAVALVRYKGVVNRCASAGGIVYGPVVSRRLGLSLGVDLCPPGVKACTLDCLYCQCGRTDARLFDAAERPDLRWPGVAEIDRAVEAELARLCRDGVALEDISLCGNGEPTLHPEFNAIVERIAAARDRWMPNAKLTAFSSALSRAVISGDVTPGLLRCDRRLMKLDAGTDVRLRRLARPAAGGTVDDAVAAIARLPEVDVQTMIVSGPAGNDNDADLVAWADALARAHPARAHVVTLHRKAAEPGAVSPAPPETLERAAAMARERGIPCEVYSS